MADALKENEVVIIKGRYDDLLLGLSHRMKENEWIMRKLAEAGFSEDTLDEAVSRISKFVLPAIISGKENDKDSREMPEDDHHFQIRFGSRPYALVIERNLLELLGSIAVGVYEMMGDSNQARALLPGLLWDICSFYRKAWKVIPPEYYCIYMFCQVCAAQNADGMIQKNTLVRQLQDDGKCRGWPIYPDEKGKVCRFYCESSDSCGLKNEAESSVDVALSSFVSEGVLIPLGGGNYRFAK